MRSGSAACCQCCRGSQRENGLVMLTLIVEGFRVELFVTGSPNLLGVLLYTCAWVTVEDWGRASGLGTSLRAQR